jgi:hypothetical protein
MFTRKRAPVVSTTGVRPTAPQVVPEWWSDLTNVCPTVSVTVTAPAGGSLLGVGRPLFEGTSDWGAVIVVSEGSAALCQAVAAADGRWSCQPDVPLADGSHAFMVTASKGGAQATAQVAVTVDTTPPLAPTVGSPIDGSVLSAPATVVTVSGSAEPGAMVRVSDGAVLLCSATADGSGAWACTSQSPLSEGAHNLSVVAVDAAGHESVMTSLSIVQARPVSTPPDAGAPVPNAGNDTGVTSLVVGVLAVGCGVLVLMVWKRRRDKDEFLSQAARVWSIR